MRKVREQDCVSAGTYSVYRGAEIRCILFADVYNSIIIKIKILKNLIENVRQYMQF